MFAPIQGSCPDSIIEILAIRFDRRRSTGISLVEDPVISRTVLREKGVGWGVGGGARIVRYRIYFQNSRAYMKISVK